MKLNAPLMLAASLTVILGALIADDKPPEKTPPPEITPAAEQAIAKSLKYMSGQQRKDGGFQSSYPVAATSMAGLAFLAGGNPPGQGKYGENVRNAIRFILKSENKQGYICEPYGSGMSSGTHGHGFATLFLAECLGMVDDSELYDSTEEGLRKAVNMIENTQNRFGGWNSAPDKNATDDGSGAVAIMQIAALRAARSGGIYVEQKVLEKSRKYLLEMTSNDGWYQYNYNSRGGGQSSSALTGAGMYMLGAMDLQGDKKYEAGIANLMKTAPFLGGGRGRDNGWGSWYYYTAFYASLAIYQYGGAEWEKWYPGIREELIKKQDATGKWPESYQVLDTAFATLVLEFPYRLLPMFQDGGRGAEGRYNIGGGK